MTLSQRRQYVLLCGVEAMADEMLKYKWADKSRKSLNRIMSTVVAMRDLYPQATPADVRWIFAEHVKVQHRGNKGGDVDSLAWANAILQLVSDMVAELKGKNHSLYRKFEVLEGMLTTFISHMDPELSDVDAMNAGEWLAKEIGV